MCTLIVLDRVVLGCPLVVASNRDEYFARAAAPPGCFDARPAGVAFVAPQDLEAGGTWMGLNANGVFVGLTNRAAEQGTDKRSRGKLIIDLLGKKSPTDMIEEIEASLSSSYNPFFLLCADGQSTYVAKNSAAGMDVQAMQPGVHVLGNREDPNAADGKVGRIRARVKALDLQRDTGQVIADLKSVLASHDGDSNPLGHVCVHTADYGTRSSAVLVRDQQRWRYEHADGAPCSSKYRDFTSLLEQLQ